MIKFGFTIDNFCSGFLCETGEPLLREFSRNLGLGLVLAGTLAMLIGVWNSWAINQYLEASPIARGMKARWAYAYVLAAIPIMIGVVTSLFLLRVL